MPYYSTIQYSQFAFYNRRIIPKIIPVKPPAYH